MLAHIFTLVIYQPFLNILVFFYWALGIVSTGKPDMGIAVILLTIVIRVLLLPISLMEDKSEKDRRFLVQKAHEIEKAFSSDPIRQRQETKKLFKRNRNVVWGEMFSLVVQVCISLMLWRIFATGLTGEDLHLIYPFMPKVELPFNLMFMGKFDLTHPHMILNLLQSLMIFLVETVSILASPYPPMKGEVVRLQLVLPVISFLVFMFLPAGKKLFVITALTFSLIVVLYKYVKRRLREYGEELAAKELAKSQQTEQLVVETK
jgi:YidC/Oxa1 family membrane protein insertase